MTDYDLPVDWDSLNKAICADCLADNALKELAAANADEDRCDYCGREGEGVACDADIVMTRIDEGLAEDYTDPINVLFFGEDGGWEGPTYDTDDVIGSIEETIGVDDFVIDVIAAYGAAEWTDEEPYITPRHEALIYSWDRFAEIVKYESRFLFLTRPAAEYPDPHDVAAGEMLDAVGAMLEEAHLIRAIEAGTDLYRARPGSPGAFPLDAKNLGTAPRDKAFSNRMSPAGIALFYGALAAETAAKEVWSGSGPGHEQVAVARFVNSEGLRVLDLSDLPPVPSRFAEERALRTTLRFLHPFVERISRAVRTAPRSVGEEVEYVPTQIVSEYLRTTYADGALDGLLYRSVEHDGGICAALFVPPERCVDADAELPPDGLVFAGAEEWMTFP